MVQVAVFDKDRPDKHGAERRYARDPLQFLEREIHVLQRQDRGGEETLECGVAEIGDPVVVSAGQRIGHVRIAHQKEPFGEPGRV